MYKGFVLAPVGTSGTDDPGVTGPQSGRDLRLVELVAHTWLEPGLSQRYRADARSVLDEFGVTLASDEQPPALPENPACELTIEELSRPTTAHAVGCFCLNADDLPPGPAGELTIEELSRPTTAHAAACFCLNADDLPPGPAGELTIEELSRPATAHAAACFCLNADDLPPEPASGTAPAAPRAVLR
ncbi:TIGR04351 family putative TOMM peptide [Streptomyces sp. CA-288835]|uniref:TIGR04351 family putative TOMM peptide n=1 Tax=Streptomyces sp. CA-288835 TaxID=3240069 RepID=UPI003D94305F